MTKRYSGKSSKDRSFKKKPKFSKKIKSLIKRNRTSL